MLDSQTTTMKQNVRFQEGINLEKHQFDQIQNGRLSVISNTNNMHTIWKTVVVN